MHAHACIFFYNTFFCAHAHTQVRALHHLSSVVENMANHRVGTLLKDSRGESHGVDVYITNAIESERTKTYQCLVRQCAEQYKCQQCCSHLAVLPGDPLVYPCRGVQQVFRLLQYHYEGFSPSHLGACRLVQKLHQNSMHDLF